MSLESAALKRVKPSATLAVDAKARALVAEGAIEGVNLPTPRGVWIGRVR